MVEVAGDEGTRRRLPLWMQGKASKPGDGGDKNDNVQEDGDGIVSGNSKPKKQSKKASLTQEKGETKRRKRKISQQDAACDVEPALLKKMSIGLKEKQVQESSIRRKRKATSVRLRSGKDSKIPSPVDDDDDEELTPEDLLSIAEEYVKADKDIVLQELSIRECEFGRQLSTTASSKTKSESSLIAFDGNRRSPAHETTYNSTQSLKGEKYFIDTSRTGDPAQDMLDLFLGPLLKKTVEEKRTEFIMKDLTFSNELGKGSQNDVKEEKAPLMKKKCTLRDKPRIVMHEMELLHDRPLTSHDIAHLEKEHVPLANLKLIVIRQQFLFVRSNVVFAQQYHLMLAHHPGQVICLLLMHVHPMAAQQVMRDSMKKLIGKHI